MHKTNKKLVLKDDHFSFTSCNNLNQLIKPLYDLLNVNLMTLRRFYKNGKQFYIATDHKWIKHYFDQDYQKYNVFKGILNSNIRYAFVLDQMAKDSDLNMVAGIAINSFEMCHGVTLKRVGSDYTDIFNFTAPRNNESIKNLFWLHIPEIEKFIDYFYIVAQDILQEASKPDNLFGTIETVDFSENIEIDKRLSDYYQKISNPHIQYLVNKYKLSTRETECLNMLSQGLTSKIIANKLQISHRTVELYITNVRNKIQCNSKQEIIELINNSRSSKLLI